MVAFEKIIVELKTLERLTLREESQLLNYLKATGLQVGVLFNFGHRDRLDWKRMILTDYVLFMKIRVNSWIRYDSLLLIRAFDD